MLLTEQNRTEQNRTEQNRTEQNSRNYGIDLLRIVAMYMIVVIHLLNKGGVFENEASKAATVIDSFIAATVYSCVNCYALISGFVGYREGKYTHKFSGLITMWFQVAFYGLSITAILKVIGTPDIGIKSFLSAALPISRSQYWYFTAYVGVTLLAPYLHLLIDKLDKKAIMSACLGIIVLGSFYSTFSGYLGADPFVLKDGYTFIWLSALYLLGAVIQKYKLNQRYHSKGLILTALLCVFITGLSRFGISAVTQAILGQPKGRGVLFSYLSPTIVLLSLALLILFSKIRLSQGSIKLIKFAAPATFGVYLIHVQPIVFSEIMGKKFQWIAEMPGILPPIVILLVAFVILAVCLLIDRARMLLFDLLKIKKLSEKIECLMKTTGERIVDKLFMNSES